MYRHYEIIPIILLSLFVKIRILKKFLPPQLYDFRSILILLHQLHPHDEPKERKIILT